MIFYIFDIHWYPASAILLILASNLCFFGIQHGARCDMVWLCFWKPFTQCKHRRMMNNVPQCTTVRITTLNFVQLGSAVLFRGFNLFQLGFTFEYVRHGLDVLTVLTSALWRLDSLCPAKGEAKPQTRRNNKKFRRSSEEVRKKYKNCTRNIMTHMETSSLKEVLKEDTGGTCQNSVATSLVASCDTSETPRQLWGMEDYREAGISRNLPGSQNTAPCAMRHAAPPWNAVRRRERNGRHRRLQMPKVPKVPKVHRRRPWHTVTHRDTEIILSNRDDFPNFKSVKSISQTRISVQIVRWK